MTHGSVKMIIMSHLSDLQQEIGTSKPAQPFYMTTKLNFVKYLLMNFSDTTTEINADEQWATFYAKYYPTVSKNNALEMQMNGLLNLTVKK